MTARPALATPSDWRRHPGTIAVAVVALHAAGLWALQSGLLRRAVETVVPAEILVEMLDAGPQQATAPAPPSTPRATAPAAKAPAAAAPTAAPAIPSALAVPAPATAPAVAAPTVATVSGAPDVVSVLATAQNGSETKAAKTSPAATAPAPRVELPNSDVAELNNPKSKYPVMSWRLGEQGIVVVSILVGTDGNVKDVRLAKSSGFDRLDQDALAHAQKLRFIPGKVDGVPQAMWRDKPFNYQLTRP
ncbi:energy transducer TonB [Curvibacter sp. APW13]|uniref:energy transducer TonB n=1 Tax=Curvibacter sp. APW13 TaxID=3077236 RepID=UPI0028DF4E1B|nr:energy transducer TonB [Curvibacter sp. APW13]MDT8992110.1 energy transducer TonB [Curvibacter sp. APW13]